ncbi:N-acetyltransferase family protein [Sorangium sp. So ce887]|uniref:GNAT family N-acetyltransferase n=1 Tax=Sorangium sp. So ce887 TaxID=3133324 RepID=UPI003F628442
MEAGITLLTSPDLATYVDHRIRQSRESGQGGTPPSHFFTADEGPTAERLRAERADGWSKPVSDPCWLRTWGAWVDGALVAHIELRGATYRAALHRATLGMGVERRFQRAGIGTRLMETALAWARAEASLHWIDLGVFSDNHAALCLYDKHSFSECGRVDDAFRIDDRSITALQLRLRIKGYAP